MPRQTVRAARTHQTNVESTRPGTSTCAVGAFILWIRTRGNGSTGSVGTTALLCGEARHTGARALRVATDAFDAINVVVAVRRTRAWAPCCADETNAAAIACSRHTFVVGIDAIGNVAARSIRAAPLFGCRARLAIARAGSIAANAIRTEARCALRRSRAYDAEAAHGATCRAAAFARTAFAMTLAA